MTLSNVERPVCGARPHPRRKGAQEVGTTEKSEYRRGEVPLSKKNRCLIIITERPLPPEALLRNTITGL